MAKGSIFQVPSRWRQDMFVARFREAEFHVESNNKESGRRTVTHEYPKKEKPYTEDMGRRAKEFSVRGYCIVYPHDADKLFQRDYRKPRDELIRALEQEGRGVLQLPTLGTLVVMCTKYRVIEESKRGGYCVFDMSFVEFGLAPSVQLDSGTLVEIKADSMKREAQRRMLARQKALVPMKREPQIIMTRPQFLDGQRV